MRLYRLCQSRWADSAFSGEGAARFPARWHRRGTHVVYTATHTALAALEVLVHFDWDTAPTYVLVAAEVPDDAIEAVTPGQLPTGWDSPADMNATQRFGTAWVDSGRSLGLAVPSVVVPEAVNVLVNPRHPRMAEVLIEAPRPFSFDPRLRP